MVNNKLHSIQNCPIAVVGMSGLFPEADDIKQFWNNILAKKNCIKEIGENWPGYWRAQDYYDPDPKTPDMSYSKKAGFIPEIAFDPLEFNLPPANLEATSQDQLFSLVMAKKALQNARLLNYHDKSRIGVILGVGEVGNVGFYLATRTEYQNWKRVLENFDLPQSMIAAIIERLKNLYPQWQENSLPGFLGNVVCGRITHHFNLGGPNYSVNAACASSLMAIKASISELRAGTCDAVLTGGVNIDTSFVFAFMSFTKTPVISPTSMIRPYDENSNGIMLGDGIGMIVLKRLEDAERDGDKIYGVITGIGTSSDGKADSIYAPKVEGQVRALKQAYEKADCSYATIGLMEGHGTGTMAGDFCEFQALNTVFNQAPKQTIALGSVKSQIGHTRVTAGVASVIKTLIALDNKILPPTINVSLPNPKFAMQESAFYLNTEARPWIHCAQEGPRRAGVSSFGFGGTNFHLVLEEYNKDKKFMRFADVPEILFIQAGTVEKLLNKCHQLLASFNTDNATQYYENYLESIKNIRINPQWPRIGFVVSSIKESIELLNQSITMLTASAETAWDEKLGIYYHSNSLDLTGRVVALFSGAESQYLNMASKLAQNYPEMRQAFEELDKTAKEKNVSKFSSIVFPPPCFDAQMQATQHKKLAQDHYAQPAIGTVGFGFYKLLKNAGFKADFLLGTDIGELTALWAANILEDADFFRLAVEWGKSLTAKASFLDNEPKNSFQKNLANIKFKSSGQTVYSTITSKPYSEAAVEILDNLTKPMPQPNLFAECIKKIHNQGGYVFVEIGPKKVLSNWVKTILKDKNHISIALNPQPEKDAELQFRQAIVQLMVLGMDLQDIDPYRIPREKIKNSEKTRTTVKLNGGIYFNPTGLELRNTALQKKVDLPFKYFSTQPEETVMNPENIAEKDSVLTTDHYFHKNYETYLKLVSQLIQNQTTIIDKLSDHPNLGQILNNITETQKLLEKVQTEYVRVNMSTSEQIASILMELPNINKPAPEKTILSQTTTKNNAAFDTQQLVQKITQLIAKQAGCAVDTLDLKADLELNLGLDIFKVLEISAALQEEFAIEREILEEMFELPTLADIIHYVSTKFVQQNPVNTKETISVPVTEEAKLSAIPVVENEKLKEITEQILNIISSKTGYPTDVLEADMDLSGELGIDSIKMVEILGEIQTQYPQLAAIEEPQELSKFRTISHISTYIYKVLIPAGANAVEKKMTASAENNPSTNHTGIRVFLSGNDTQMQKKTLV